MGVRNGCPRPGSSRHFWSSNASLAEVLCVPPYAVRVWVVFSRKWVPRPRLGAFFFRLQHLSSESAIFHDFRKNVKNNHFESRFAVLHKISAFTLGVSQNAKLASARWCGSNFFVLPA